MIEKIHHAHTNQKKAEMIIVISNKINFGIENINSDKYFIIKKGSINQENKILKYNNRASKYIGRNTDRLKGEIDESTFIVRGFNTFFSIRIWGRMFQE